MAASARERKRVALANVVASVSEWTFCGCEHQRASFPASGFLHHRTALNYGARVDVLLARIFHTFPKRIHDFAFRIDMRA